MLQITPQMRILVCVEAVDFRNGIDGLAQRCKAALGEDPFRGTVFVFRNRRSTAVKVLAYDGKQLASNYDVFFDKVVKVGGVNVALVNVGDYMDQYTDVPPNVHIDKWYPQPSVIPQVDAVIHHGGNNSFTECLYFGKPAIIMPYVWDGHDNATRVEETGHGFKLDRYEWTDAVMADRITRMVTDKKMKAKLKKTSKDMRKEKGPAKAAKVIDAMTPSRPP